MNKTNLTSRVAAAQEKFTFYAHDRQFKLANIEEFEKEIEQCEGDKLLLQKTDKAMEELIRALNDSSIAMVEDLVSRGLTTIFGREYVFKIEVETKRGNLTNNLVLLEDGEAVSIMDSYGGGLVAIVSILLRIVKILIEKPALKRLLILDESLTHLSKDYVHAAAEFIKNLCKKLDFTIIMVSHDDTFMEYADVLYQIKKEGKYATIEKVR